MVENRKQNDSDKFKEIISRLDKISIKNLEIEITRREFNLQFSRMSDAEKLSDILCQGEDDLIRWHLDEFKNKKLQEIDYESWKDKAVEAFAKTISLSDFLEKKQLRMESAVEYFKNMERFGKQLKLKEDMILEIAKKGLIKNKLEIRLAICGEKKITKKLYEKIKEADVIGDELYITRRKKKENSKISNINQEVKRNKFKHTYKKKEGVNIIENEELLNKDNYIYIKDIKCSVLFDTGAKENYISRKTVEKLKIEKYNLKVPKRRYTCLKEEFIITECVKINFVYQDLKYVEIFYILPKREDVIIIMGRDWLRNQGPETKTEGKTFTNEMLIEELAKEKEGNIPGCECKIETLEGKIVVDKPYKLPQAYENRVEAEVGRLVKKQYIRPSKSAWLNNVRPVVKPDGSIRLTTNLIRLNKLVVLDKYSLPNIDEIIYKLKNQKYYSKIDLKEGFFQIKINEQDCHKTAFRIKNRLYEWIRMPMGFKNSPAIFQRAMDTILEEYIGLHCYVYVDDILIFGKTKEEHDIAFRKVVQTLIKNNITANKEKIVYCVQEIKFLGHTLKGDQIIPCIDNKASIKNYPAPENVDEVKRFLGIVNYYRKFIKNCATIQEPLLNLTRKNVSFDWDECCRIAFESLKKLLLGKTILQQPDFEKEFVLETDASNVGLGAVLCQRINGELLPVAFASRKMGTAERNYSISEKEMLAALWAMEHFVYFLLGREFTLITDHKALKALDERGTIRSARIERWIERIQIFNFKVEYRKGCQIPHVDGLSRIRSNEEVNLITNTNNDSRKKKILDFHKNLVHRGANVTCEEYNKVNSDKVELDLVKEVLRNCVECKLYNPIKVCKPYYIN